MQFESFGAFLNMGGYGFYVWLSFGISALLICALVLSSLIGHKQVINNIALRQQRENKLRQLRKQRNDTKPVTTNTTNTTKEIL